MEFLILIFQKRAKYGKILYGKFLDKMYIFLKYFLFYDMIKLK